MVVNRKKRNGNKSALPASVTSGLTEKSYGTYEGGDTRSTESVAWFKIGLVGVCTLSLFWSVWSDMAHEWWTDPTWSQGMLLPPLALYIAWANRQQTLREPARRDSRGLFVTALGCVVFLVGKLASEFFLMRFSSVIVIVGLVWTFWGLRRLRSLGFPFLLLATMVPLPAVVYNAIAGPLQLLASDLAARFAQLLGIAVYRDGNIIQLASVSLGVAEACSGISSLSALTVGSMLLGHLVCPRMLCRILLIAIAIPLAVAVNVARVTGTAVLADYNPQLAMGLYHLFSGWLVFAIGFASLYLIAETMRRWSNCA